MITPWDGAKHIGGVAWAESAIILMTSGFARCAMNEILPMPLQYVWSQDGLPSSRRYCESLNRDPKLLLDPQFTCMFGLVGLIFN